VHCIDYNPTDLDFYLFFQFYFVTQLRTRTPRESSDTEGRNGTKRRTEDARLREGEPARAHTRRKEGNGKEKGELEHAPIKIDVARDPPTAPAALVRRLK
jgi:hypothetical protein